MYNCWSWEHPNSYEPAHEMMALFDLRKLILQTCIRRYPMGLGVWYFIGPFVHFHTSCVRTAKALARLRRCAGSPEPSLVAYVISTIISWAGLFSMDCTLLIIIKKNQKSPIALTAFWSLFSLGIWTLSPLIWPTFSQPANRLHDLVFSQSYRRLKVQKSNFLLWKKKKKKKCGFGI